MKFLRANIWWSVIVPQVLGWVYFALLFQPQLMQGQYCKLLYFFVALVCTALFGYLFNDFCDVQADARAGKPNIMARWPLWLRFFSVLLALGIGVAAWLKLQPGALAHVFFSLQVLALVVYSAPPFRLKSAGVAGVVCDAFYGHINPMLLTLLVFTGAPHRAWGLFPYFIAAALVTVTLKGVRNILLHQIDDRKNDSKAGIATYVVSKGGLYTVNLLNRLLAAEFVALFLLVLIISLRFPPFIFAWLFFLAFTYLKFSGWKLAYLPPRQLKVKFLFFMNDFYEGWMPVAFLVLLGVHYPWGLIVLILHLLAFPSFAIKTGQGIKTIKQNFKTEEDY